MAETWVPTLSSPSFSISTTSGSIRRLERKPTSASDYDDSIKKILLSPAASNKPSTPSTASEHPSNRTASSNVAGTDFASHQTSPSTISPTSRKCSIRSRASTTSSSGTTLSPITPITPPDLNCTSPIFPLKIPTLTTCLSSGFPYHESLFNLHISPTTWAQFSLAVVRATKLTLRDKTAIGATYGSIAMTGLIGTSIIVGHKVARQVQRNRVRASLSSPEETGLGTVLERWNEGYFSAMGLRAAVWVSEDGTRNEVEREGHDRSGNWKEDVEKARARMRRFPFVVVSKESRREWQDQRKYMIVLVPASAVPGRVEVEGDFERGREELEGDFAGGVETCELQGDRREVVEMDALGAEKVELPTRMQEAVELDSTPIETPPPAYENNGKAEMIEEKAAG